MVRSSKMPALVGDYHVTFCPTHGKLSSTDAFVSNGRQRIPLAGDANLEPGDLLGFASAPLLRVPFDALAVSPSPSPPPSPPSAPAPGTPSPTTAPAPRIHVVDAPSSPRVSVAPLRARCPRSRRPLNCLLGLRTCNAPAFCACGTACLCTYVMSFLSYMTHAGRLKPSTGLVMPLSLIHI